MDPCLSGGNAAGGRSLDRASGRCGQATASAWLGYGAGAAASNAASPNMVRSPAWSRRAGPLDGLESPSGLLVVLVGEGRAG
jgi:hypothetical protein